jgi:hypothetical protein
MSTVQFKRFSEILLVQIDGGANALNMDWAPVMVTVARWNTERLARLNFNPSL